MPRKTSLLLSLALMIVSAWAIITAKAWPWKAALFPIVIGIPVLCLAGVEFLLSLVGSQSKLKGQFMDFQLSEHLPKEVIRKRTLKILSWIFGFFFVIMLVGFPIAVPLFVFLYLKIEGREGWMLSSVLTLMAWGFFYGLFTRLLNLPFPDGSIVEWIRRLGG